MILRSISVLLSKKVRYLFIVFFIVLLPVLALFFTGCTTAKQDSELAASTQAPENFQVTQLAISATEVNPGEELIISANVTNTSSSDRDYIAELRIDNLTEESIPAFRYSEKVTIAAGTTQPVTVTVSRDKSATYQVSWDGLIGEFVVVKSSNEETPQTTAAFQTVDLAINPIEVYPGVEIVISAKVTNTSNTGGTYTAGLKINDADAAKLEENFSAGESRVISFVGSINTPGIYEVSWVEVRGGSETPKLSGEFMVIHPDEIINSFPVAATDFTGVDVVTSESISLSQFKNSVVLLNFVNYGCNPSINQVVSAQLLEIKELAKQRDDFQPLSVFCGCCPPEELRNFAEQNDLDWPWILDSDNSIVQKYASYLRIYGYPTLIFVDKEQNIRDVLGYSDLSSLNIKIDEIS